MAINPDLFECFICGERPASYVFFAATEAGKAFSARWQERAAQPGWTGPQPSIGHPDSASLCADHAAAADTDITRDAAMRLLREHR